MRIRTSNSVIRLSVAFLLLAGITIGTATGNEYKIVFPNALATTEGDESTCQSIEGCVAVGFREQILYEAAEFSSLPQPDLVITGMYLRPDHTAGPRSGDIGDYLVRLSTTTKGPGELDLVYANNVGDDVVTVLEGTVSLATQAVGPEAGPKDFDYYFPFQTPFPYDPFTGRNLLVDQVTESGILFVGLFDAFTSSPPRAVFSYDDPTAASGSLFNVTPVVQFVFAVVPEPAAISLMLLGIVAVAVHREK